MTIKKFLAGSLSSVMVLSCLNIGVAALEPNALDDGKDAAFSSADLNGNYSFYVIKNY